MQVFGRHHQMLTLESLPLLRQPTVSAASPAETGATPRHKGSIRMLEVYSRIPGTGAYVNGFDSQRVTMSINDLSAPYLTLIGFGLLGGWPVLIQAWEVPLAIGTFIWGVILIVVLWFIVRSLIVPPGPSGA